MMKFLRDTMIVCVRELRPTLRNPLALVFNLSQPLIFLLFFGPLLEGMPGMEGGSPWQWFAPGILVMLALSTTSGAGYNMLLEMQTGSHERLLVTPLSRSAMLVGRALKEIIPLLLQAVLIVLVVLPFGFRLYPAGMLIGLVLLSIFGVGLGALSYALAISVKNQEWIFWIVQQTFMFPLMILSGMLLPMETAPQWMQTLSRLNPLTHIVEAERALFAGQFPLTPVLFGSIAAVSLAVVGLTVGTRVMRRAAA
jgi:ABC-2 type transport system permease protein